MKEKIGIEKLIELFKEYVDKYSNDAKVLDEGEYVVIDDGQSFLYGTREYSYLTLISKKFGFIKWLVENDKIDTEKVGEIGFIGKYDFETNYYLVDEDNVYDKCETLLMLLSISSSPIDDLLSYLK